MLNTLTFGQPGPNPPLVIVHGLFGSGRNWGVIAKRLSTDRLVLAPDLRNHGESPRSEDHSYGALAGDLSELIAAYGGQADVVGHSMGGKAAMVLALTEPDRVASLVVADIAPVRYLHSQMPFIEAMRAVDLGAVRVRSDAAQQLSRTVEDPALQSFFTQSLDLKERRWRLNLDALADQMPHIMGFPGHDGDPYGGPCLFLSGGASDYVRPEHRAPIRALFPRARFASLPGAGHWLHAEKPRDFEASIRAFLGAIR